MGWRKRGIRWEITEDGPNFHLGQTVIEPWDHGFETAVENVPMEVAQTWLDVAGVSFTNPEHIGPVWPNMLGIVIDDNPFGTYLLVLRDTHICLMRTHV